MSGLGRHVTHWTATEVRIAFRKAFLAGKNEWADLRLRPIGHEAKGRVLIVASKKVGSAPYRNLLKRRTRAILAVQRLKLPHTDIIIFFKPYPQPISFAQLEDFLVSCLKKHHTETPSLNGY